MPKADFDHLLDLLETNHSKYNNASFIDNDPVSVPHRFSGLQDIEIAGFFAATLAWGQRKTIINKSVELMESMDNSPFDFITNHSEQDLKPLLRFKHRTFNTTDLLYFIHFFKTYYAGHDTLEDAFVPKRGDKNVEDGLNNFHQLFISNEFFPHRTGKHVASPAKKSACKRINMYLRWMVRKDENGVDFGLWQKILPSQLICPCDVHVEKVARRLGLVNRKQVDWRMAVELTENLKQLDAHDPVKYDFALFGMGIDQDY